MYGLIDPFYERSQADVGAGQIWCDQPVYLPARHGLKITRVDPDDDRNLDYEVCGRTAEIFTHPPVHSLTMESTEGAVIAKTKRDRPVIVLGGVGASEFSPARGPRYAEIVMVVPIYGADQYDDQIRRRMSLYGFANAFYLPAAPSLGFGEGYARLDHVQAVSERQLARHRGLKLVDDALAALHEWLMTFLTDRQPAGSMIADYRQMMIESGSAE